MSCRPVDRRGHDDIDNARGTPKVRLSGCKDAHHLAITAVLLACAGVTADDFCFDTTAFLGDVTDDRRRTSIHSLIH